MNDRKLLEGRRAIVTGAGQGLGVAIACALARDGARVLVTSRDERKVQAAVERVRALGAEAEGVQAELTDPTARERVVGAALERWGGIDVLVNNAGTYFQRDLLDFTHEDWEATIDTNLSAPFFLLQAVARVMVRQGTGGSIINIASIHAKVAEAEVPAQAAAKFGLLGLTQSAAEALRPHDIRVNAVCPGAIEPDSADRLSLSPRRKATQGDIATLVTYLASDLSGSITGTSIDVFGSTRLVLKAE